jgi:ABC-type nitrate/sulfonate/bicarbonate transport system ATPase subunit
MKPRAMLVIEELNKQFNGMPVIRDLSCQVAQGERLALFAPSGAGKTTLLRILAGLEQADSGRFLIADPAPAIVFQEPRLFPFLTVEENIFLPFKAQKREISRAVRWRYLNWLAVCELENSAQLFPTQLSGGMKQKVAVMRALLGLPRLVLMDEPFQSIGFEAKAAMMEYLLEENPQLTILFITHIPEEIPLLAQKALVFQQQCLYQPLQVSADVFLENKFVYPYPAGLLQSKPDSLTHRNVTVEKKETL